MTPLSGLLRSWDRPRNLADHNRVSPQGTCAKHRGGESTEGAAAQ
jgi:hypothetical protein